MRFNRALGGWLQWLVFFAGLGLLFLIRSLPIETVTFLQRDLGYWMMCLLCLASAFYLRVFEPKHWRQQILAINWMRAAQGAFLALLAVFVYAVTEPIFFKIIYDEQTLVAISQSMAYEKVAAWPAQIERILGVLTPTGYVVDKRPLLYPFLLSCLHSLIGYRPENAFVFNAIVGFAFSALIFGFTRRVFGAAFGLLIFLVWMSSPLWAQNVMGGGFEVLNLFLILIVFCRTHSFLKNPSERGFGELIILSALLSNVRYESVVYALMPGFAFLFAQRQGKAMPWMSWPLALSPFALFSPTLANSIFGNYSLLSQSADGTVFSVDNFSQNIGSAVYYLFNFDPSQSNSLIISILGSLSLIILPILIGRCRFHCLDYKPQFLMAFVAFAMPMLVHLALLFSLNWGTWDDPFVARFTLPFQLFLVLVICYVAYLTHLIYEIRPRVFVAIVLAYWFLVGFPTLDRAQATQRLMPSMAIQWAVETLDELNPDRSSLVIAPSSLPFTNEEHPAAMARFVNMSEAVRQKVFYQHRYDAVFVLERLVIRDGDSAWRSDIANTPIHSILKANGGTCIAQYPTSYYRRLRIWKITDEIDLGLD